MSNGANMNNLHVFFQSCAGEEKRGDLVSLANFFHNSTGTQPQAVPVGQLVTSKIREESEQ